MEEPTDPSAEGAVSVEEQIEPPSRVTEPRKSPSWGRKLLSLLVPGAIGVVIGLASVYFGLADRLIDGGLPVPIFLAIAGIPLLAVLAFIAMILIHELGHLIMALLVGFQPVLLLVGPFKLMATRAGYKFDIGGWGIAGGVVAMPKKLRGMRWKLGVMFSGGVVGNLAGALLAFLAFRALGPAEAGEVIVWMLRTFLGIFAGISVVLGLINLVPLQERGLESDGSHLRTLLMGGERMRRLRSIFELYVESMNGTRPRDWDRERLEHAISIDDGSYIDMLGCILGHYHAEDTGDLETVGRMSRRLLAAEGRIALLEASALSLAAYHYAKNLGDADTARKLIDRAPESGFDPESPRRARAAVLLAEGKFDEAAAAAQDAIRQLDDAWVNMRGMAIAEEEWLTEILQEAENAITQSSPLDR